MKPPKSYESLLAVILLILGGVFTLLGLAAEVLPLPMRGGEPRGFALWGLPLLLFGAGLLWYARRRERLWARLRTEGRAVQGKLVPEATRRHWYTSWGSSGLRKRNPWTVMCIYRWEERTYCVRSQFLWRKPGGFEQRPTVYLDPLDPRRAWIDPETLVYEVSV